MLLGWQRNHGSGQGKLLHKGAYSQPTARLARIFHESLAATADIAVLPGVLGCRILRRTAQVRLETDTLRLPGGTAIFTVSPQQFMKYPG